VGYFRDLEGFGGLFSFECKGKTDMKFCGGIHK